MNSAFVSCVGCGRRFPTACGALVCGDCELAATRAAAAAESPPEPSPAGSPLTGSPGEPAV
jgi:hypothetical protein